VFSRVNLIDRVQEAVRTVDRLSARLGASNAGPQAASADLVGRVALQVVLIRAGIEDALSAAPSDAVLILEPILDDARAAPDAAWRDELFSMYVAWAQRRRMQFSVVEGAKDEARVLVVSGFGAWRTLSAERGLHVLEVPQDAGRRREAVRVRVAEGPPDEPPAARRDAALRALAQQAPSDSRVRRRYRRLPAPLVRDVGTGERSGHLDLILGGDFDLVFPTMRLADRTLVATAGD
jgi:ATP-dependent Clp protease ATP-binding subunit ClpC